LTLAFLFVMALLGALLLFNAILAASAASHAIGSGDRPFPADDLLVWLTWDFVIADAAILLIALGILVGSLKLALTRWFGWLLIFLGAFGIIVAALFMAGHLAACPWMKYVTPGEPWTGWVNFHPHRVL